MQTSWARPTKASWKFGPWRKHRQILRRTNFQGGNTMQLNPYLLFNGQCEAAMKFYEKCLNGKITMIMTYGDSPAASHVPAELAKQIIHATLSLGDFQLQASDCPPDKYQK